MENLTCCNCGIIFGVPEHWVISRREDKRLFYCPNGHSQSYTQSASEVLQYQKDALERRLQAQLNEANHLRLVVEKELASEKRKRRKIEKRIAAGVCPCCNRTFEDLHRHMQTKHKDYALPPANPKAIEAAKDSIQ